MKTSGKNAGLYGFVFRRPKTVLFLSLLLSLLSVVYTRDTIRFLTGRDDLMPQGTSFNRDYRAYRGEFGDQEEIVVVVECEDAAKGVEFGEKLQGALLPRTDLVREVFFPGGLPFFRKNGLLFMPLDDLESFRENIHLVKPVLKGLAADPSVQSLFTTLTAQIDGYLQHGKDAPAAAENLKSIAFTLGRLDEGFRLFGSGSASLSLESFFFRRADGGESAFVKAGKMQILTVLPVKASGSFKPSEAATRLVRGEIARLKKDPSFAGVTAGLTGTPVLEYEEMATSERDVTLATIVSLALTVVLLLLAFRGIGNVFAAMVSLGVALCASFGFATLAVGHLNILSMVFAVMLIGIGIEYGIQVVLRYQEELKRGETHDEAILIALQRNTWGIVMAAATVAAAFLTFVFTDFRGIAELGIIAGGGIALCVLSTFTVLPAMLVLLARFRKKPKARPNRLLQRFEEKRRRAGARELFFGHPKKTLLLTAVLCIASLYPAVTARFDYNLMNLQARGLESVTYAYKLMRSSENSGYFAAVTASTPEEAREKKRRLEALPAVDHVVSIDSFIPDEQEKKLSVLAAVRRDLEDVQPKAYEENLRVMELPAVFENFRNSVVRLQGYLAAEKLPEEKGVGGFLATLDAFFAKLEKEKDRNALGMLRDFQGGLFAELPAKIGMLKESLPAAPAVPADVPTELRSRFVGTSGKLLLQVAPKGEIFDREPLERFLSQVRSVDPRATGEPVMVYESMTIMRDAYKNAFLYAVAAIVVILLVAFRSVLYTVIGLVPLVVGMLFMTAGMRLLSIDFNSANIIVLPLVLGVAVDSGIYIINRFRRENESPVQVIFSSTGLGVLFNTLTIMASFGALMVARHQGVYSIGAVMSLGMLACQIAFIVVLPAVLALVRRR